jgi:solute carrier family 8 (sodium/calcium exchanger)
MAAGPSIRGCVLFGILALLAVSSTGAQETAEVVEAAPEPNAVAPAAEAEVADNDTGGVPEGVNCADGLLIPIWKPFTNLSTGDRFGRGLLYVLLMVYLFIGVSIVSDRFMESIEMITAQEKEVTVKDPKTGKSQVIIVKVWNETVANLSLMALGSSAPEILLSVVEIFAKNFQAGELGPGTIVGSAAFNLFMIIGLCMYVIPDDEVRKIKHLRVFLVTATWSVFAYVWLYVILGPISYGIVEPWEGIVTFLFFPATVWTAYVADRRLFCYKYMSKSYRAGKHGAIVQTEKADIESRATEKFKDFDEDSMDPALAEFERNRREYINAMKRIRLENPDITPAELELRAREEVMSKGPKSRAYYRLQATRKLAGKQNLDKTLKNRLAEEAEADKAAEEEKEVEEEKKEDGVMRIMFDPPHYTVMENVGKFEVTIVREGGDLNIPVMVDYKTEDGSACSEGDYIEAVGTLTFGPGVTEQKVTLEVLDDDVFEEDEHFYIRISNPRRKDGIEIPQMSVEGEMVASLQLGTPHMATIMILDDDHGGVFQFENHEAEINESVGVYELKVARQSGARGKVAIPYTTEEGTAKAGKDFEHVEGELIFCNEENEKIIEIPILEEDSYEKNVVLYAIIGEPKHLAGPPGEGAGVNYADIDAKDPETLTEEEKIALLGRPRLGDVTKISVRIRESKEFKSSVDRMLQRGNASMMVGASSWKDQFLDAFTVQAGDDDEEEEGEEGEEGAEAEEKMPTCGDYIMHFLTLVWKIIFAVIPPAGLGNGYPCFVISIAMIGVCTAVIGDVAGHLGCFIFLKDSVNAIAFVALGTSVPDTFASKVSAIQDETADASVGNVTGSNAVNVFLGIGIAWSMAAIYWASKGENFNVSPGSLGFSVTIFCTEAVFAILILLARRNPAVGGELGGPKAVKTVTSSIFVFLWVFYVLMASLEAYDVIQPGF